MKLYANIKSERAEKGQGGNEFLDIEITNDQRQKLATISVRSEQKTKITVELDTQLVDLAIIENSNICKCDDPLCAKCLLINCKDQYCKVHTIEKKKEFREIYNNR